MPCKGLGMYVKASNVLKRNETSESVVIYPLRHFRKLGKDSLFFFNG